MAKPLPAKPKPPFCFIAAGVLAAVTLLAYLPTMRGGFIWDDDSYVQQNQSLRTFEGLWNIWAHTSATPQYYPLVHTTFWIEYHLWGATPQAALAYKILNVLLHTTSVILLWRLLIKLELPGAWLAAAIFAVHPVNVESVAWITERKNVLCGVFYLLAVGSYLKRYKEDGGWRIEDGKNPSAPFSILHPPSSIYLLSLLFFLLALFSKTIAATMPAAILLILYWKRGHLRRKDVTPLIPFFLIGAAMGALTGYLEQTQVGAHGPEWSSLTFVHRLLIAGRVSWFYASKLLLPINLSFIYPRWNIDPHDIVQYLWPIALIIAVVGLWASRNRIGRGPLVAVLFFLGTLFPALGFANVLPMRYSFVADHFQYLAALGLICLFTAGIATIKSKIAKNTISTIVVLALATLTLFRTPIFNDPETLWRDTLQKNPGSWMAHANLGHTLKAKHRYEEAFAEYQKELQLAPERGEPHMDVGYQLAARGDMLSAISQFRSAVTLAPTLAPAYSYLAKALREQNRLDESQAAARAGTLAVPQYAPSWYELGRSLEAAKKFQEASTAYTTAIDLQPDDPDPHFHQAACLQKLGNLTEATRQYQLGIELLAHPTAN